MEPLLRALGRRLYRRLPGRPLHGVLTGLDHWLRCRRAGATVTVRRNGIVWELDLGQLIDSSLYHDGVHEPGTARALERLARPGMTVFDVGANVGAHTLPLASRVGHAGHVYAFEPTRWASDKLRRNLALNPQFRNVQVERIALSDQDRRDADYRFRAQWTLEAGPGEEERGRIDFLTLDTFCRERSIDALHLMKLDVDGYESKILRGARSILQRYRPILIVEVGDYWQRRAGDDLETLLGLLAEFGYEYRDERRLAPIDDLAAHVRLDDEQATVNVVCLPRGMQLEPFGRR